MMRGGTPLSDHRFHEFVVMIDDMLRRKLTPDTMSLPVQIYGFRDIFLYILPLQRFITIRVGRRVHDPLVEMTHGVRC